MADYSFVDGNVPTATQWNSNVRDQGHTICTSSTRPSSPVTGRLIFETDTSKHLVYDGSAWVDCGKLSAWTTYTPTWTAAGTAPAIGNGTITGRYQKLYGRSYLTQVHFTAGSTTTFGTGQWSFSTPGGLTAAAYFYGHGMAYPSSSWAVSVQATGTVFQANAPTSSTDPRLIPITATAPEAWGSADQLLFTILWESTT